MLLWNSGVASRVGFAMSGIVPVVSSEVAYCEGIIQSCVAKYRHSIVERSCGNVQSG